MLANSLCDVNDSGSEIQHRSNRRQVLCYAEVRFCPISEVTTRPIEVRSVKCSGLDLLNLSFSHFDPSRTASVHRITRKRLPNGVACREVVAISVVMLDAGPSILAIVSAFCH